MTNKELLYVEDALGHEKFLKDSACKTSNSLQDQELAGYMKELETKHNEIYSRLLKLL